MTMLHINQMAYTMKRAPQNHRQRDITFVYSTGTPIITIGLKQSQHISIY